MRRRRGRLPVLAEIAGPGPGGTRVWSLRRGDIVAMQDLLRKLDEQRVVLTAGDEALSAAISLAGAAGASGRRTVLLECDLARPGLASELGIEATPGLHEYLRWEATAAEILQPLALAGPAARGASEPLVCVTVGTQASDPATLLNSDSFRHAIAKLRGAYDLVVLAGPTAGPDRWSLESVAVAADLLLPCLTPEQASPRGQRPIRAALRRLRVTIPGAIVVGDPSGR